MYLSLLPGLFTPAPGDGHMYPFSDSSRTALSVHLFRTAPDPSAPDARTSVRWERVPHGFFRAFALRSAVQTGKELALLSHANQRRGAGKFVIQRLTRIDGGLSYMRQGREGFAIGKRDRTV
jgi:hypothetical protein